VRRLAPTARNARAAFASLNRSLPPLRAYAIEMRPAIAELPGFIAAGKPWVEQAYPLLSGRELGGTARLLGEGTPGLAGAAQIGKASVLPQTNRLSLCTSRVIVPTGNQTIDDQFSTGGPNYREFFYMLASFSGWGGNFDGNGPFLRIQPGGGNVLVSSPNPNAELSTDKTSWAHTISAPAGTQPQLGGKPPKKPEVRCDSNSAPDVNGTLGQVGPPSPAVSP
jgi:hypothetical protein